MNPAFATTTEFMDAYDALGRSDFVAAEPLLTRSLEQEPNDPYALLSMGAVMERTGRLYQATIYYRSAARYGAATPVEKSISIDGDDRHQAKSVRDLALLNLARIEAQ
jgi:Tfp pilus assembly protein PilF